MPLVRTNARAEGPLAYPLYIFIHKKFNENMVFRSGFNLSLMAFRQYFIMIYLGHIGDCHKVFCIGIEEINLGSVTMAWHVLGLQMEETASSYGA
jgi:hypothetical protein